ncbi:hypothetical protein RCL1_002116 [Eukaryota sp. TZLM3-RCL]
MFVFACFISYKVFDTPWWKEFITALVGSAWTSPSSTTISRKLPEMRLKVEKMMLDLTVPEDVGVTLVSDAFKNVQRRTLLNFLIVSIKGAQFIKLSDSAGERKTGEYIAEQMKKMYLSLSETSKNLVQIITDAATVNRKARKIFSAEFPRVSWNYCICHRIDLFLEDVSKKNSIH